MSSGIGIEKTTQERYTTGTRYEMIRMMYWATWVHVTDFIPPSTEQNRTPRSPTNTPTLKSRPMNRETMSPTPVTCAMRYVNEHATAPTTPMSRGMLPPNRAPRKSGMV